MGAEDPPSAVRLSHCGPGPGVCTLPFADRRQVQTHINSGQTSTVNGRRPSRNGSVLPVLIISFTPSRTSRSFSISFSVESDFPINGSFFLDRLAACQAHPSSHDSSLPRLRGFKRRIFLKGHYGICQKCQGRRGLGTSRRPSVGSHPRGQGKGRRLGERNARSAAACAVSTHALLSLTHYSLTMPLLGSFLPCPTSPSRVVNKVGFERLVSFLQYYYFPSGRSCYHPHRHYF